MFSVPESTSFTCRRVKTAPEKPRFIIVGFQTAKDGDQTKNPYTLDHVNLKITYVTLNSDRYPSVDYNLSFSNHKQVIVDKFVNKKGKVVNIKRELRFIDSLRFMASSLDNLSSNLKIDQFVNLKKYYSDNQLSLLLRKGVYQYDYVDCMNKLYETSLYKKEAFFSKLTDEGITDEDYQFGRNLILSQ